MLRKGLVGVFVVVVFWATPVRAELNCAEQMVAEAASAIKTFQGKGDRFNIWNRWVADPILLRLLRRFVGEGPRSTETKPLPLVTDFQYYANQPKSGWWTRTFREPVEEMVYEKLLRQFYQWDSEDHWNGLSAISPRDKKTGEGAIVLPHHPSPLDPMIQRLILKQWDPGITFIMYEDQAHQRPRFARYIRALLIPSERHPHEVRERMVNELIQYVVAERKKGRSFVIYPEGKITRALPMLEGQSAHWRMHQLDPNIRWVYAQLNGFAGDPFTANVTGDFPKIDQVLIERVFALLYGGGDLPVRQLFPKYELHSSAGFKTLREFSDDLVAFWNRDLLPPRYTPQWSWEPPTVVELALPERPVVERSGSWDDVPAAIQKEILAQVAKASGHPLENVTPDAHLQLNLNVDSIKVAGLQLMAEEMGKQRSDQPPTTVEDLGRMAIGKFTARGGLIPPPSGPWARQIAEDKNRTERAHRPEGTVTNLEALRYHMEHNPDFVVMHDDNGPVSYRTLFQRALLFIPRIQLMKGDTIVVNLPPSAAAMTVIIATWLAGKKVYSMNSLSNDAAVCHVAGVLNAKSVITSEKFVTALAGSGRRHPQLYARHDTYHLENLVATLSIAEVIATRKWSLESDFWKRLDWPKEDPYAPVFYLATSGSSGMPKVVGYTPAMDKASGDALVAMMDIRENDVVADMNTKGHAVGWRLIECLLRRVKVVFHANPAEFGVMARKFARYGVTILPSVPAILDGIAKKGLPIPSLRLVITGAEKMPADVRDRILAVWPQLNSPDPQKIRVQEAGGATEGLPVIGQFTDSVREGIMTLADEHLRIRVVNAEKLAAYMALRAAGKDTTLAEKAVVDVQPGEVGIALYYDVRGPGRGILMQGYVGREEKDQPFATLDGIRWFVTGDLYERDRTHPKDFKLKGRDGDLIKRNGEMVPVAEMPRLLAKDPRFTRREDEIGPLLAVVPEKVLEKARICLFTTRPISFADAYKLTTDGTNNETYADKIVYVPVLPTVGPLKPAIAFFQGLMARPGFWDKDWTPDEIAAAWTDFSTAR